MIWKGQISFGLVSIPVALHPAEQREELDFTLLDRKDLAPIGYRKVSKATGREVPGDRITRGFEYAKGRYVVVSEADLKRASPERTQRVDILSFTDRDAIDPRYYERPYYLLPVGKSDKGYALLREALEKTGKIGIASVVLRARQHLAALLPMERILVLNLLRYASELRDPAKLSADKDGSRRNGHAQSGASAKERRMAEQLVLDMVEPWKPDRYHDEYKDELMAFIRHRVKKGAIEEAGPPAPKKKPGGEVVDIMELLQRSLKASGGGASRGKASDSRRRSSHRRSA